MPQAAYEAGAAASSVRAARAAAGGVWVWVWVWCWVAWGRVEGCCWCRCGCKHMCSGGRPSTCSGLRGLPFFVPSLCVGYWGLYVYVCAKLPNTKALSLQRPRAESQYDLGGSGGDASGSAAAAAGAQGRGQAGAGEGAGADAGAEAEEEEEGDMWQPPFMSNAMCVGCWRCGTAHDAHLHALP